MKNTEYNKLLKYNKRDSLTTKKILDKANVLTPVHYTEGGLEVITIWKAKLSKEEFCGLCKGNVIKYICRAGKKNPLKEIEDLEKAMQYLKWLIEAKKENE